MVRRRRNAVRKGYGTMCNICGKNCGRGGALKTHIEGAHDIDYNDYKRCYKEGNIKILTDAWCESGRTSTGRPIFIHVLVRKFYNEPGERGVRISSK